MLFLWYKLITVWLNLERTFILLLTTTDLIKTHVWLVRPDEIVRLGELCTQSSQSYIPIWQTRREFEIVENLKNE